MASWALWVIAAVLLAVGESVTMGFYLAPFAVGALAAAVAAAAGAGGGVSWILFFAVSLLMLWVVRPIARSHRRTPARLRTGTAALVGKPAVVLERIANHEAVGCVRIDSEVWTARAYDEDEVFEPGARVEVVDIRGATALVAE